MLIKLFDDLCRNASHHYIVWHILCHHSTCSNDGIPANGHTRTDDGTDAYPRILLDGHLSKYMEYSASTL
jgi:hypothetical protein